MSETLDTMTLGGLTLAIGILVEVDPLQKACTTICRILKGLQLSVH